MSQPATLNINTSVVVHGDSVQTNNPRLKFWDWNRNINGVQVYSPKSEQFVVPPQTTQVLFNGTRSTTLAANSAFDLKYLSGDKYRLQYTGGTDPTLATNVTIPNTSTDLTVTVNANQTVTLVATQSIFTNIVSGQTFYVLSAADKWNGSVYALSPTNSGVWVVLSSNGTTTITLARPSGTSFDAVSETLTGISPANAFFAYTLSTVQVNDKLRISGGFSTANQGVYSITAVTSKWVEFASTLPLADESNISGLVASLLFYAAGKRYVRVEADQRVRLFFNGAVDTNQEIEPWLAGDSSYVGWDERTGPVWSLSVFNLAAVPAVVNLFSVE